MKRRNLLRNGPITVGGLFLFPDPPSTLQASHGVSKEKLRSIFGKIQWVTSFPDFKVKIVDSFADLHVQRVSAFPCSPGKWQEVNCFPDFKIQRVDSFPDFTIQYVDHFPGVR